MRLLWFVFDFGRNVKQMPRQANVNWDRFIESAKTIERRRTEYVWYILKMGGIYGNGGDLFYLD